MRDITNKRAYLVLGVILTGYGALCINELSDPGDWPDYDFYGPKIAAWEWGEWLQGYDYHVSHSISKISLELGNPKVMPLALSIGLIAATFLLARQVTGKNYAGIMAGIIIPASAIFRQFDTSAVYPNDWILFLVMAMYFAKKRWHIMPVMFGAAVLCTPLVIFFVPVLLAYFHVSNPQRIRRKIMYSVFGMMIISGAFLIPFRGGDVTWNAAGFMNGAAAGMFFFIVPDFWLAALFPVFLLLLVALAAKRIPNAGVVLAGTGIALFHGAFVEGFTTHWWNEPYRYVSLVVFFAISAGLTVEGFRIRRAEKEKVKDLKSLPKME